MIARSQDEPKFISASSKWSKHDAKVNPFVHI